MYTIINENVHYSIIQTYGRYITRYEYEYMIGTENQKYYKEE